MFMPKNITSITIIITLEGIEKSVWLEAAKLTCTSPPAMELLHAVFTSDVSLNQPLTFVDLLPLVEKIENLDFLRRLLCFQP